MLKAYKYRLTPTMKQVALLDKHFNACRLVYNLALETKITAYESLSKKKLSCFDLINQIPDLKKECIWLKEVSSQALQQSVVDLDRAFSNFFNGIAKFPSFKRKRGSQRFRNPDGSFVNIKGNKICVPKFRKGIRFVQHRLIEGEVRSTTISKTSTGKYFISVLVENGKEYPSLKMIHEKTSVGIDLGLKHFAVTDSGLKIDNPKFLCDSIERIKILQRRASRKMKGSNNRKKANLRVALQHERIANQRNDFLHKLSTQLINSHDTLCLETLGIQDLLKNPNGASGILDAGWGVFVDFCKYKAGRCGKNILRIPRFEPSTKICSVCAVKNNALTLKDREWLCVSCGTFHDRDVNAAINIKNYCLNSLGKGIPDVPVEVSAVVESKKQEVNY